MKKKILIFSFRLKIFEKKNEDWQVFVEFISLDLYNEMLPFDIKMFNLLVDLIEHVSLFCYNRRDNLKYKINNKKKIFLLILGWKILMVHSYTIY